MADNQLFLVNGINNIGDNVIDKKLGEYSHIQDIDQINSIINSDRYVQLDKKESIIIGWPSIVDMGGVINSRDESITFRYNKGRESVDVVVAYTDKPYFRENNSIVYSLEEVTIYPLYVWIIQRRISLR